MARKERKSKKAKSGSVKVNFKGVESRQTPPEGDYIVEVLEAAMGESGKGNDQIEFILEIAEGKYKGVKLYLYCTLDEKSLWKLHAFMTALGMEVPDDELELDLADFAGEKCVGVVTHETYNGKKRAKMTDFDTIENYSGDRDDDDDDDDDKKGKKSKKSKKEETPDYDDMDEDDLREAVIERKLATKKEAKKLDEDELKELLEEADKKASKGGKSKKSKDDDDEDEDEDDKKSSKKSKKDDKGKAKKKAKKLDRSDVEDMDEDELQELIDEHDLDVDLDDYKKLPKKVEAVLEALEEAELVDEEDD